MAKLERKETRMESAEATGLIQKKGLRALDADLPFLATKAAVELDMFTAGKDTDLRSVMELAELIRNFIDIQSEATTRYLMDPSTVTVMSKAISDSKWVASPPKTIGDLVEMAQDVATKLSSKPDRQSKNGELQRMKEFCIALARCASVHRQSVFGQRRKHPYRK